MRAYCFIAAGLNPVDKKVHLYTREYKVDKFGILERGAVKDMFKFVARESFLGLAKG
jgi:hypothetical protein